MIVEIEFKQIKLKVQIFFKDPTFEETELGISGQIVIENIKLEDSEIDIMDLLFDKIDYIKLLTSDQL